MFSKYSNIKGNLTISLPHLNKFSQGSQNASITTHTPVFLVALRKTLLFHNYTYYSHLFCSTRRLKEENVL